MTRLTVIIPTYQGRRWIRARLNSILTSRDVNFRVEAFDNASTDGTRDIVRLQKKTAAWNLRRRRRRSEQPRHEAFPS
jgi:glycosyltransferase involved in cell wall biosynthesis